MQTSTLVILLTGIIAMLVALVGFLCWRMARKNDELRHKNKVIVQELERNQTLIERAVSHGVSRAALLMALPLLLGLASCTDDNDDNPVTNPDEPQPQQLADYTISGTTTVVAICPTMSCPPATTPSTAASGSNVLYHT